MEEAVLHFLLLYLIPGTPQQWCTETAWLLVTSQSIQEQMTMSLHCGESQASSCRGKNILPSCLHLGRYLQPGVPADRLHQDQSV